MRKKEVILFIVSILLVSSVYSVELPWPNNVPFGNAFHKILYTNVITSAEGEDIEVNGTLIISDDAFISGNGSGLYDLNLTSIIIEGMITEGEDINFTGDFCV
jgi:hypothetical protein